jgi:CheY-like chemotaxis protein
VQLSQPDRSVGCPTWVPPSPVRSILEGSGGAVARSRLEGKRILVVEDEFLLADEIVDWLVLRGAKPVGPAATLPQGLDLLEQSPAVDCAVLDINLAGTMVFPLALELRRRGIPLLFASAYAQDVTFPDELKHTPRLKKPFSEAQLIRAVELALGGAN